MHDPAGSRTRDLRIKSREVRNNERVPSTHPRGAEETRRVVVLPLVLPQVVRPVARDRPIRSPDTDWTVAGAGFEPATPAL